MNEINVNYTSDDLVKYARDVEGFMTSSKTSDTTTKSLKTGTILISNCVSEKATIATFVAYTTDNYLITTTIMSSSYGQSLRDKYFGISTTGHVSVDAAFRTLPTSLQNKLIAKEWLAANPELLLSKVSEVFDASKRVIKDQQSTISNVEEMLVNAHHNMKKSPKEMFTKAWLKWEVLDVLPYLKKTLKGEK